MPALCLPLGITNSRNHKLRKRKQKYKKYAWINHLIQNNNVNNQNGNNYNNYNNNTNSDINILSLDNCLTIQLVQPKTVYPYVICTPDITVVENINKCSNNTEITINQIHPTIVDNDKPINKNNNSLNENYKSNVRNDKIILENNKSDVRNDKTIVENNKSLNKNKTTVENNKSLNVNKTIIENNKSLNEYKTVVENKSLNVNKTIVENNKSLNEYKTIIENNKSFNKNKTIVENNESLNENKTIVENSTSLNEYKTIIENNKSLNENKTIVENNKSLNENTIVDNNKLLNENKTIVEDSKLKNESLKSNNHAIFSDEFKDFENRKLNNRINAPIESIKTDLNIEKTNENMKINKPISKLISDENLSSEPIDDKILKISNDEFFDVKLNNEPDEKSSKSITPYKSFSDDKMICNKSFGRSHSIAVPRDYHDVTSRESSIESDINHKNHHGRRVSNLVEDLLFQLYHLPYQSKKQIPTRRQSCFAFRNNSSIENVAYRSPNLSISEDYDDFRYNINRSQMSIKSVTDTVQSISHDIDIFTSYTYINSSDFSNYESSYTSDSVVSNNLSIDCKRLTLLKRSITELKLLEAAFKQRIITEGTCLARHLRRRDGLLQKMNGLCDLLTAHLQALSPKRSEDTSLRFSVTPTSATDTGFNQWLTGMKMVAQLPEGIPQEFRRTLWLTLAEKHLAARGVDWAQAQKICFNEWANPDDEELGVQIVKDLHRTGCSLFCGVSGQHNQAVLRRVLLAYARWNKAVGYCQGFNMLGALILQVMDRSETDSVKVMIYLIEGVLPESYFANNLRGLSVDMAVFRDLLRLKLPVLSKHLEQLQSDSKDSGTSYEPPLTNVFTMQWFLTLFCNCLPQDTVLRVWDLVFLEGNSILLRTALAIWNTLSDRILSVESADEFYSIMGVLTREMLEFGLMDTNNLIKAVVSINLPELNEMRERYMYNITPWTQSVSTVARRGLRLFYTEDDTDTDEDDEKIAIATAYALFRSPKRKTDTMSGNATSGGVTGGMNQGPARQVHTLQSERERVVMDISALKKQYSKLRERQRQAHIILTAACGGQSIVGPSSGPAMNHLLLGKSALVNHKGRRIGAPPGSVPPPPVSSSTSAKQASRTGGGETLHWKDTANEGKKTKSQQPVTEYTSTPDSTSPPTSSCSSRRSSSSTSTELCDEPGRMSDSDSLSDCYAISDTLNSSSRVPLPDCKEEDPAISIINQDEIVKTQVSEPINIENKVNDETLNKNGEEPELDKVLFPFDRDYLTKYGSEDSSDLYINSCPASPCVFPEEDDILDDDNNENNDQEIINNEPQDVIKNESEINDNIKSTNTSPDNDNENHDIIISNLTIKSTIRDSRSFNDILSFNRDKFNDKRKSLQCNYANRNTDDEDLELRKIWLEKCIHDKSNMNKSIENHEQISTINDDINVIHESHDDIVEKIQDNVHDIIDEDFQQINQDNISTEIIKDNDDINESSTQLLIVQSSSLNTGRRGSEVQLNQILKENLEIIQKIQHTRNRTQLLTASSLDNIDNEKSTINNNDEDEEDEDVDEDKLKELQESQNKIFDKLFLQTKFHDDFETDDKITTDNSNTFITLKNVSTDEKCDTSIDEIKSKKKLKSFVDDKSSNSTVSLTEVSSTDIETSFESSFDKSSNASNNDSTIKIEQEELSMSKNTKKLSYSSTSSNSEECMEHSNIDRKILKFKNQDINDDDKKSNSDDESINQNSSKILPRLKQYYSFDYSPKSKASGSNFYDGNKRRTSYSLDSGTNLPDKLINEEDKSLDHENNDDVKDLLKRLDDLDDDNIGATSMNYKLSSNIGISCTDKYEPNDFQTSSQKLFDSNNDEDDFLSKYITRKEDLTFKFVSPFARSTTVLTTRQSPDLLYQNPHTSPTKLQRSESLDTNEYTHRSKSPRNIRRSLSPRYDLGKTLEECSDDFERWKFERKLRDLSPKSDDSYLRKSTEEITEDFDKWKLERSSGDLFERKSNEDLDKWKLERSSRDSSPKPGEFIRRSIEINEEFDKPKSISTSNKSHIRDFCSKSRDSFIKKSIESNLDEFDNWKSKKVSRESSFKSIDDDDEFEKWKAARNSRDSSPKSSRDSLYFRKSTEEITDDFESKWKSKKLTRETSFKSTESYLGKTVEENIDDEFEKWKATRHSRESSPKSFRDISATGKSTGDEINNDIDRWKTKSTIHEKPYSNFSNKFDEKIDSNDDISSWNTRNKIPDEFPHSLSTFERSQDNSNKNKEEQKFTYSFDKENDKFKILSKTSNISSSFDSTKIEDYQSKRNFTERKTEFSSDDDICSEKSTLRFKSTSNRYLPERRSTIHEYIPKTLSSLNTDDKFRDTNDLNLSDDIKEIKNSTTKYSTDWRSSCINLPTESSTSTTSKIQKYSADSKRHHKSPKTSPTSPTRFNPFPSRSSSRQPKDLTVRLGLYSPNNQLDSSTNKKPSSTSNNSENNFTSSSTSSSSSSTTSASTSFSRISST